MEKIELTNEGLEKLKKEYRHLLDVERPKNTEELVEARKYGDLSENSEYQAAKEYQGKIESRIQEIQYMIENHILIKTSKRSKKIDVGSKVSIENINFNEKEEYEIVGKIEADALNNRISYDSPLGKALMGKKVGDTVEVDAPNPYSVKVLDLKK